jgi:lipoyl(octanoyl) transferase
MNRQELSTKKINVRALGLLDYKTAWDLQEELFELSTRQKIAVHDDPESPIVQPDNYLLLCEHPPVYTLGKSGAPENLLLNREELLQRSIQFYQNNRGGDITFHGPGQVVGYPILDLEQFKPDIKVYMHSLEEVIIRTIAEYGLEGQRLEGAIGIWLDTDIAHRTRKICAFGVKTSRWITMHGWALNVNTDLSYFNFIVPCGISDKGVTSLQQELGKEIALSEVRQKCIRHFGDVFDADMVTETGEYPS